MDKRIIELASHGYPIASNTIYIRLLISIIQSQMYILNSMEGELMFDLGNKNYTVLIKYQEKVDLCLGARIKALARIYSAW